MKLIDTHAHLYLDDFDVDRQEVIAASIEAGLEKIVLPNIDIESIDPMFQMKADYPELIQTAIGLHPTSVKEDYKEQLSKMEKYLDDPRIVAIGECGIDLYWDKTFRTEQMDAFNTQINWSFEKELPILVHIRDAFDTTFEVLENCGKTNFNGVFHCFSGNLDQALKAIDIGFMLGIGGVVTFKNSGLGAIVKQIDPKHIILETDSPFLAPVPRRGKRNETPYLKYIVDKLAEVWEMDENEVAEITTANANKLFKF